MNIETTPEKSIRLAMDRQQQDLACNLLPVLRLCQFAAQAAESLQGIRDYAFVRPAFDAELRKAHSAPFSPDLAEFPSVMSNALFVAERLAYELEQSAKQALETVRPAPQQQPKT